MSYILSARGKRISRKSIHRIANVVRKHCEERSVEPLEPRCLLSRAFTPATDYLAPSAKSVLTIDINGDNRPDLITLNDHGSYYSNLNTVSVLLNNGDGTFAAGVEYPAAQAQSILTS